MRSTQLAEQLFALVFEPGDEIGATLLECARKEKIKAAHFTGIGGASDVVLGYFDLGVNEYRKIPVREQVEVMSLIGNVALFEGEPKLHAHIVIGKRDGTAMGGHLIEAHVQPTLELMLTCAEQPLVRTKDQATGLPLLDVEPTEKERRK
jgi:predicted DNA-binding protein with PD1-like motif